MSLSSVPPSVVKLLSLPWYYLLCLGIIALAITHVYVSFQRNRLYAGIPSISRTDIIGSYIAAIRFYKHGKEMTEEGYCMYYPGAFRYPTLTGWEVLITGDAMIEDLRKAKTTALSFRAAVEETLGVEYTLGPNIKKNHYHAHIIRGRLNRQLETIYPELYDEVVHTFKDMFPSESEWKPYPVMSSVLSIIARVANRVFVGLPLCRDPEYLKVNVDFAVNVDVAGPTITTFPPIFRPLIAKIFTKVSKSIKFGINRVGPFIRERQRLISEYGTDYPDKPNDFLSWLIDAAEGEEKSLRNLTLRLLVLNFASVHTSALAFSHSLLELVQRPEYIDKIRADVEQAINEYGWSYAALEKMHRLDSFLREDMRLAATGLATVSRRALQDFVFSDGTRIPKGTMVHVASQARHLDDRVYKDAATFNGFRFSDMDEEKRNNHQVVNVDDDYLQFGNGKTACPGRFFATAIMKTLMAYFLVNYELKAVSSPKHFYIGRAFIIDEQAEIMIRKRST